MGKLAFAGRSAWGRASARRGLAGAALTLVASACGDISEGNPEGGAGGRSGAGGVGGQGGSAPLAGRGGTGGSSAPERDAGLLDPGGSGGSGGSAGGSAGSSSVPEGCPEPTPIPVEGHPIVIQSIQFARSEVTLRNASNTTQTLAGGNQGWQWCNIPGYSPVSFAEQDIVLGPGETYQFHLIERLGGTRKIWAGDDPGDTNELGVYTTTGAFFNSELIAAYVSWGLGSERETRESIANMADIWYYGERITIEPGHAGFIVTGDVRRGAGFTSVPSRCLPP